MARASDFGRNDRTLFARTHLGHLLHAGDTALGYDLASANVADSDLEKALERGLVLPDVILVRRLARLPFLWQFCCLLATPCVNALWRFGKLEGTLLPLGCDMLG